MTTILSVIFSILVNALFFTIHVIVWKIKDNKSPKLTLLIFIFLLSYILLCVINFYLFKVRFSEHFWLTYPTSFLIFILYIHFYVGMLKSVSLRIMGEIVNRKNMEISLSDLNNIYSFEKMVEPRLNLLVKKNWLEKKYNKYYCTSISKNVASINMLFHKLFRLNITG